MDEIVKSPHDIFVKEVLSNRENARDFFFNYLPAQVRDLVDMERLEVCKDSFVEKELREYFSDLLYRVYLAGESEGEQQPAYLYLLFEHKSTPQRWIALHLLRYQVKIWELYLKQNKEARALPMIIPLVLYHGEDEWKIGTRLSDVVPAGQREELRPYLPDFSYLLCDISASPDDQIRGMAILRASLLVLKYIRHPDLARHLLEIFSALEDLIPGAGQGFIDWLESIFRYIFNASDDVSVEELKKIVEKCLDKSKEGLVMTVAEQLIQKGVQQGAQQGWQQGIQQGLQQGVQQGLQQGLQQGEVKKAREDIVNVLEIRFGDISLSLKERLTAICDQTILEDLLRKAVTVASLTDLEQIIR
jgi:predicted transposase/invertase (TIGR01784 family)